MQTIRQRRPSRCGKVVATASAFSRRWLFSRDEPTTIPLGGIVVATPSGRASGAGHARVHDANAFTVARIAPVTASAGILGLSLVTHRS
jgi:hypothetical protein